MAAICGERANEERVKCLRIFADGNEYSPAEFSRHRVAFKFGVAAPWHGYCPGGGYAASRA
jgi:hypothetical protein